MNAARGGGSIERGVKSRAVKSNAKTFSANAGENAFTFVVGANHRAQLNVARCSSDASDAKGIGCIQEGQTAPYA